MFGRKETNYGGYRKELNEKQEKKRADIAEKKRAKEVAKEEKKRAKEIAKEEKESKTNELSEIMESSERIKSFIIEEYMNDGKNVFKCKACDTVHGNSGSKLINHVNSIRYKVKHKKYIKTLI